MRELWRQIQLLRAMNMLMRAQKIVSRYGNLSATELRFHTSLTVAADAINELGKKRRCG